ncbi:MAG: glycosyltransferase [Alphaproteobacteria bacterium]
MRVGINAQKALERETGVGNYTGNLICALARLPEAQDTLRLYLLHGREELAASVNGLSAHSRESRWRGNVPRILWEQFGLPRTAARDRLDLLHYVDHALPVVGRPCPMVITVHDLAFYRLPEMYNLGRRQYKRFIGLRSVQRAAHVIVNSEATKAEVIDITGISKEKLTVVHYGLDPLFRPLGREETEKNTPEIRPNQAVFPFCRHPAAAQEPAYADFGLRPNDAGSRPAA